VLSPEHDVTDNRTLICIAEWTGTKCIYWC